MTMSLSMPAALPLQEPTQHAESVSANQSREHTQSQTPILTFTGDGKEYFRIWVINLCLSLATLGVYSAWAKVRRLQYFDRNTQLNGSPFNFHGNPMAIFKGRLVALVLFVAYHYAFGFSKAFGVAVISVLFLTLPWMLRSALQFRLRNTSYRGVRFYFGGTLEGAYLSYTPLLALILLPATTTALFPSNTVLIGMEFLVLYLSWPVIHAAMKRYQQAHIEYGNQSSFYDATIFTLVKPYLLAFALAIGVMVLGGIAAVVASLLTGVVAAAGGVKAAGPEFGTGFGIAIGLFVGVLYAYGVYLVAGPFLQVRIWNLVWSNTRFPTISIRSELEFWPYLGLQTKNLILTLLTLGLYRPFAVVSIYRYRLARMTLSSGSTNPFNHIVQSEHNQQISATGDSSADFFGIDLSF